MGGATRTRRELATEVARGGSRPGGLLPSAAAGALALACFPLSVLFTDLGWVPVALLPLVAVFGVGGLLRALPVTLVLVPLGQSAGFLALASWWFARDTGSAGPSAALIGFRDLVIDGATAVRTAVAPVETSPQLLALLAVLLFLCALLVETLAVGLGLAGLSGLVLLTLAAAPLAIRGDGELLLLAAPAGGWLLLLAADQAVRLRAFPASRPGAHIGAGLRGSFGPLGLAAAAGMATGLVLAALAPSAAEPAWLRTWWNDVVAPGGSSGNSLDPFVSVRSQLTQGSAEELLRYRSPAGQPTYLGMTTLEIFDGEAWSAYPLSPMVPLDRPAPGSERLGGPGGPTLELEIGDLGNPYLPVPDAVVGLAVQDPDSWGWDPRTGDAVSRGASAAGTSYRATTARASLTPETLDGSGSDSLQVSPITRALPPALPPEVADIAAEVTAAADSNYRRALALQQWFTTGGGFAYSVNVPDPGERDPLLAFLADRVGFCQQYATAMAIMARTQGIPARVVVGFTGGRQEPDGAFTVTGADAHAWPELWFDEVGWVRFEPTPTSGSAAVVVPPYTEQDAVQLPPAAPQPDAALDAPPVQPTAPAEDPSDGGDPDGRSGALRAVVLAGLGLLLTLLVPPALRQRARAARLRRVRDGDAIAAWDEVAASAVDAGLRWPTTATIRQQAEAVGGALDGDGLSDAARLGLRRLAVACEHARYAPAGLAPALRATPSLVVPDEPEPDATEALDDLREVIASLDRVPRPTWDRIVPRSVRPGGSAGSDPAA